MSLETISDPDANALGMAATASPGRARGVLRARFGVIGGRSFLARLFESDGLRLRCPKTTGPMCEAVAINTAGGVVGGDHALYEYVLDPGAQVLATTQSAEKIYKSDGATARIDMRLKLARGATLIWAPQETILFNQSRLTRSLNVELAQDARLLILERLNFGRQAMSENLTQGRFEDDWRISRNDRLIFADRTRLAEDIAGRLNRPAGGGGARAAVSLLFIAPDAPEKIELLLERARPFFEAGGDFGASAFEDILIARAVHPDSQTLHAACAQLFACLGLAPAPRVWE